MDNQDLLKSFSLILQDLLFDDTIKLTLNTTRASVPGWDSFAYINFIVAVEMQYRIKFGVAEVESFDDVGAIVHRTSELIGS